MQLRSVGRAGLAVIAVLIMSAAAAACGSSAPTPGQPVQVKSQAPTLSPTPAPTPWPSVIDLPAQLPASQTYEQTLPLFAYRGDRPFGVVEKSASNAVGATVKDITFIGAAGEPVDAYLILPDGDGPFAGILYEHGSGGSRVDFMAEATRVAKQQHIAGLVVTQPTSAISGDDLTEAILQVREMRRALDFLASQPQVDRTRLGYVGHSLGAIYGTVLLSVDSRIKAAVLMAVVPAYGQPSLDISVYAPHITGGTVLFQFGHGDSYYTQDVAEGFADLVPTTKKVAWYDAGHVLNAAAGTDRAAWLAEQLAAK